MKLKYWGPAIMWAIVIFTLSTGEFSSDNTKSILETLMNFLFPNISIDAIPRLNHWIRKMGHWSEYFIFAVLIYHGFRAQQKRTWHWSWAALTLCLVTGYAFLDELHQFFVPSRTADIRDSLLDTMGGICGLSLIYFRSFTRRRELPVVMPDGKIMK